MNRLTAVCAGLLVSAAVAGSAHAQAGCKAGPLPKPRPPASTTSNAPADPAAVANLAKATAFLADNAKKPGVVKLPSGAQYKVLTSGAKDGTCASIEDRVKVIYEGTLTDGKVFDSSEGSAVTFPLSELVPGWQHVVPLMRPGDEWMIYLPPNLGYGTRNMGDKIPPNSALIFKMKLVGLQ